MNVANLRHVHRMAAAVIVMAFIVLIGWAPEQVFAQSVSAGIPYDQSWKNDSGKTVDNTFSYLLEAEDSKSPMPSEGGSFKLTGNDKGTLDLTFTFWKPGYYHYKVTPQTTKKDKHYTCDTTVYHITLMVVNGGGGSPGGG